MQASSYTLRVWDYLICSSSSSLVFLVTAILLRLFRDEQEIFSDSIMEVCQRAKDSFEFNQENTEELIRDAENLRKKFCYKKQWVEEYNDLLLEGSNYRVNYTPMIRMLNSLNKRGTIFCSVVALGVVLFLTSRMASPSFKPWMETIMGPAYAASAMVKDFIYLFIKK